MQRDGRGRMKGLLVTATVAPLLAGPSLQGEQVSQMVLGEGAEVVGIQGDMLHVRTIMDSYSGWIAAGYVAQGPLGEVEAWLAQAAWSEGALLRNADGVAVRAPHRARLKLVDNGSVQFPNGDRGEVLAGAVSPYAEIVARARTEPAADWAWREFAGTPYLWGGVTGAGIDCSGLTQNVFLARGVTLPRDAHQQVGHGQVIDPADRRDGDLLFFRSRDRDRIGHVGLQATADTMVHSTVDTGGVVRESLAPDSRAHPLLARLVAVRRID
jgi:cell wall-associated NlpC family hydrolase